MIRNYLKIAWRSLLKHPATTSIHLLGLTIGLTTCLLILLFIQNEWSYDQHHQLGSRIYRVNQIQTTGEEVDRSGITPYPLAPAMRLDFPDLTTIARIHAGRDVAVMISKEKILLEKKVLFAEPELFSMFDFELVQGNGRATLSQPNQVILTESTALKYFGTTSAIGKTFRLDNRVTVQVTGIMRDIPSQSNLNAGMVVSFATMKDFFNMEIDQWGLRSGGSVFVMLPEGKTPGQYTSRLATASQKYFGDRKGEKNELLLQPLYDIHLNPEISGNRFAQPISPVYMYVFGAVGLFVLLIACVNFINMSTARAMTRAREVGVRKVVGATRGQLVRQFLSEAFWLAAFSALLALLFSYSLLPHVNDFLQKQIAFRWTEAVGLLSVLALLTTISAGMYPAFFLSRFKPMRVLKSVAEPGRGSQGWLRQGLVVFQFTISLVLAVGVLIVYRQMNYFQQKDLGFNRNAIAVVGIPQTNNLAPIAQELRQIPGVENITFALGAPTSGTNFGTDMRPDPANQDKKISIALKMADADYLDTYGLKLLAGRFFTHSDTLAIASTVPEEQRRYVLVVNENSVKALGFSRPEQALGHKIGVGLNDIEAEIVGVVKDFHTSSLRDPIQPMVMINFPYFYRSIGLKLHTTNYKNTMAAVESVWRKFYQDEYFDAEFLDQSLQAQYEEEMRQFTLLRVFAGLALIICCLGLWGLAAFVIERRTKEIGVRKVLGASVTSLISMLNQDFLKLVLIAIVVATPIAWYAMDQWLQNFNYRIGIEWWIFVLVGVAAVAVSFLTVSFQSIKAALMNPVKSLRSE